MDKVKIKLISVIFINNSWSFQPILIDQEKIQADTNIFITKNTRRYAVYPRKKCLKLYFTWHKKWTRILGNNAKISVIDQISHSRSQNVTNKSLIKKNYYWGKNKHLLYWDENAKCDILTRWITKTGSLLENEKEVILHTCWGHNHGTL